jgi:DNA-binding YbaB/EbfC family protein
VSEPMSAGVGPEPEGAPMSDFGREPTSGEEPSVPDLGALLSKLGEVTQNLQEAQESVASRVLEGSAGGGAVKVRATGGLEFQDVTISPEVVDPDDVEMLQDLVLAAIRDVVEQAHADMSEAFGGFDLGGGLGGLGGLLGR